MPRIPSATVAGLCLSLALLAAPGLRGADLLVPAEHPTIQAAIIAAQFGDTILVSPGTYTETIDFLGKGVSVASTGGASVTIIDGGQQQTSVVSFSSGEGPASVIEGFTIRNGLGTFIPAAQRLVGGGVYCGGTSPVIRNNIIMSNQATNGGGICCLDSFAEITGNLIEGNFASDGGGIHINDSSPTVSGNTIRLNSAFGSGGGVYCFGSAPLIGENLIDSNSATAGGGLHCRESSPSVSGNTISGNTAVAGGGGIYCDRLSSPEVIGCTISGNSAGQGGGLVCTHFSDALVMESTISGNSAEIGGGVFSFQSSPQFRQSIISGNASGVLGQGGGGGGMAFASQGNPFLVSSVLAGNISPSSGGAILCDGSSHPTLVNTTLWQNSAGGPGGAIFCKHSSAATIWNSILWENTTAELAHDGSGAFEVFSSDVQGGWPGEGNFDAEPLVDGGFHLLPCSPCIDQGAVQTPGLPLFDFEGEPRVSGNAVDVGADEATGVQGHCFVRGDCNVDAIVDIADASFALLFLFGLGDSLPECEDACDGNDDGFLDLADPVFTLLFLFSGGAPIPEPFGSVGPDPTADSLDCVRYIP